MRCVSCRILCRFPRTVSACLQVGWVTGPARLVGAIAKAHQFVTFCIPSNLQRGVAFGLQNEQWFYTYVVWHAMRQSFLNML